MASLLNPIKWYIFNYRFQWNHSNYKNVLERSIDLIQNRPSLKDLPARPCFCLHARRRKHARLNVHPRDNLKAGLGLTLHSNRLSNGRAMPTSILKGLRSTTLPASCEDRNLPKSRYFDLRMKYFVRTILLLRTLNYLRVGGVEQCDQEYKQNICK